MKIRIFLSLLQKKTHDIWNHNSKRQQEEERKRERKGKWERRRVRN